MKHSLLFEHENSFLNLLFQMIWNISRKKVIENSMYGSNEEKYVLLLWELFLS
jgi:hypothetical protein